jgi:hypothetical protein
MDCIFRLPVHYPFFFLSGTIQNLDIFFQYLTNGCVCCYVLCWLCISFPVLQNERLASRICPAAQESKFNFQSQSFECPWPLCRWMTLLARSSSTRGSSIELPSSKDSSASDRLVAAAGDPPIAAE